MGGIARIAVGLGHEVSGSDENTYPPMSTQLSDLGIEITQGYEHSLSENIDLYIIGNALSRGNPMVEKILNKGLNYTSGPQWLSENVLRNKWVLAVSGTHGKTTTASMILWILESCGYEPSYLIGGVCHHFNETARINDSPFFVIEADEYDSAFFDKRSKMIHYHPKTLIINNLEFDHADIFPDLEAIKTQFHHLLRIVPEIGQIIIPDEDNSIDEVINKGCWSEIIRIGNPKNWSYQLLSDYGSEFKVTSATDQKSEIINWNLIGIHNVKNAVAAMAAVKHVGVLPKHAAQALKTFKGVKRRMEFKGNFKGINIYEDFAHHPTAIKTTLSAFRKLVGESRIVVLLDLASNTMKTGHHRDRIPKALEKADRVFIKMPQQSNWLFDASWIDGHAVVTSSTVAGILEAVLSELHSGDQVLVMSNGSFGGIIEKLQSKLKSEG